MEINEDDLIDYAEKYGIDKLIGLDIPDELTHIIPDQNLGVDPSFDEPVGPEIDDLIRLHYITTKRKVTTILEFGTGYSTIVLADALSKNKANYCKYVKDNLRRNNAFELHVVDAHERYIEIVKKRMPEELSSLVHYHQSNVVMGEFNGRICTYYQELPNICPDFIYLDGPDQYCVKNNIRGISTAHTDRLPMTGDLLAIEHYLLPGTFILVDGRTANARFLKYNFQRNWHYHHNKTFDYSTFELFEKSLGPYNEKQVIFCLGIEWLKGL
jgi:hypothetical protein